MPLAGQFGFHVDLQTPGGKDEDGTQIKTNTYQLGDNDYYTIVLPDTVAKHACAGRVDVWTIPEAELAKPEHGLFGTAEDPVANAGSFYVYRPNEGNPRLHAWTRKYPVRTADGAWVAEKKTT